MRRLRRGDAGDVAFGAAYQRHTKTFGRQFNLAPPTQRAHDIQGVVGAAFDATLAEIHDDPPAGVPHEAASA